MKISTTEIRKLTRRGALKSSDHGHTRVRSLVTTTRGNPRRRKRSSPTAGALVREQRRAPRCSRSHRPTVTRCWSIRALKHTARRS